MVKPSPETPTVYTAVELNTVLDAALKRHETELLEMDRKKQELQELSKQHRFRPSDEFFTFKILKRTGDVVTTKLSILNSTEKEWFAVVPAILTVFSSLFFVEDDKKFLDRGGTIRFITDITHPYVEVVQQHLDMGMEVRHFDKYSGLIFCVFDRKISITAINTDLKRVSLNESVSALWTDDPTYAQYLAHTFKWLWEQAAPAEQRIGELLKEGPPQV
jgi:sugar-specific transcriptional regulator TrmB